jgi:hypothetical protein
MGDSVPPLSILSTGEKTFGDVAEKGAFDRCKLNDVMIAKGVNAFLEITFDGTVIAEGSAELSFSPEKIESFEETEESEGWLYA